MNKNEMIKKDLLRRKIQEYFTKNPKAKSFIVKADAGSARTLWKVVREGKKFNVVEINTERQEFVFESGISVVQEASIDFSNLSKAFVQAVSPPFDHARLSQALKTANMVIAKIVDPKEKDQVGSMIGVLTNLVDSTTAGGGSGVQRVASTSMSMQNSSKKILGKVIKEEDEKNDDKEKKSVKKKESEKTATQKLDPSKKPITSDIEIPGNNEESEDDLPTRQPTSEEMVVAKTLTGQSIKAANVKITPDGGELELDLISSSAPSKLKWWNDGKVVFYANGRPYIINRG